MKLIRVISGSGEEIPGSIIAEGQHFAVGGCVAVEDGAYLLHHRRGEVAEGHLSPIRFGDEVHILVPVDDPLVSFREVFVYRLVIAEENSPYTMQVLSEEEWLLEWGDSYNERLTLYVVQGRVACQILAMLGSHRVREPNGSQVCNDREVDRIGVRVVPLPFVGGVLGIVGRCRLDTHRCTATAQHEIRTRIREIDRKPHFFRAGEEI
jgi:hypothetical protein